MDIDINVKWNPIIVPYWASHFIKTVEDVYEPIVNTSQGRVCLAFGEASGDCL